MAIAYQVITKNELDATLAGLAQGVRDNLILASKVKTLVDLQSDDVLTAHGYDTDDIYLLRSIAQDLNDLVGVATGVSSQETPKNFLQRSNSILGVH